MKIVIDTHLHPNRISFMQIQPETQIHEEYIENARRFSALFERTLLGIYILDNEGTFIQVNQTAADQLGYSVEELIGKPFDSYLADDQSLDRARSRISRLIKEHAQGEPMELVLKRKSGEAIWIEIESALLMEDGCSYGIIGIALDITERKRAELREKHLQNVSEAVHTINQLIVRERSRHMLIINACNIITSVPEYLSAWIVLFDENGDMTDFASSGRLNDVQSFLKDLKKSPPPACIVEALNQPGVVLIDSRSQDSYCRNCHTACISSEEIKIIGRLCAGTQVQGIMGVSATNEYILYSQEKALITEAASDIGFGLYRIVLEETEYLTRVEAQQQRNYLELALEASGMGEWDMNIRTGKLRWGERLMRMYGIDAEEFEGTIEGFKKRIHPQWRERLLEEVNGYFRSAGVGAEYQTEYPIIHRSGQTRWLQSCGRMVAGADSRPERIVGLTWDITDRKQTEEALRISEERYRTFMQETVEGIYLVVFTDPIPASLPIEQQVSLFYQRTRIAEANDAFAQMYGYTSLKEMERIALDVFHGSESDPANIEFLTSFVKKNYRLANAISHEVDRQGNRRVFLNNLFGIVRDGALVRVWGTQQDVTELTKAEEELRHQKADLARANFELSSANKRLMELDKIKSEFVSMASHELRTPITSILGFAQTLLSSEVDVGEDEQATYLTIIQKEAKRLGNLISDLLDLSRIEVGRTKGTIEQVSLDTLASEVIESMRIPQNIRVMVCGGAEGKKPFPCNSDAIRRVFLNLIENALRFADKIDIRIEGDGDTRTVSVCDNGPGIAPEHQEKIFEKFYRVQTDKQSGKGSGLGLAMVKDIVEMHGGRIWVESEPGRGAAFYFTLKAKP